MKHYNETFISVTLWVIFSFNYKQSFEIKNQVASMIIYPTSQNKQ